MSLYFGYPAESVEDGGKVYEVPADPPPPPLQQEK
jgi:hypothetical protein